MLLTQEDLEAVAAAALPVHHGSVIIHIDTASKYLGIDTIIKNRIPKDTTSEKETKAVK